MNKDIKLALEGAKRALAAAKKILSTTKPTIVIKNLETGELKKVILFFLGVLLSASCFGQRSIEIPLKKGLQQIEQISQKIGIVDSVVIYTTVRKQSTELIIGKYTKYHSPKIYSVKIYDRKYERYVIHYHEPAAMQDN
jgi:hypothetical protein